MTALRWSLVFDGQQSVWVATEDLPPPAPPPPPRDIDAERVAALARIDREAEGERLRLLTPGAGQALVYAAKEAEARRWLALYPAGPPVTDPDPLDWPWLAAELGVTAPTLHGVAQTIAAIANAWTQAGAAIEAVRLGAKRAVESAETVEELDAALAVVWPTST